MIVRAAVGGLVIAAAVFALVASTIAAPLLGGATPAAPAVVNFASPDAVIDLRPSLSPNSMSDPANPDAMWLTILVKNEGVQAATRVLEAGDSPSAGLAPMPLRVRPTLKEIAASDSSVVIEQATAYGKRAFRVILPPAHSATLALHFEGALQRPTMYAWTESALIAHNRRAAVLSGLVAGLLAAAAAFVVGAAALTGRRFTSWGALFLGALLFANLTASGVFDTGWLTDPGGPYGLFAFAVALALAAGIRLVDFVAPFEASLPGSGVWRDRVAIGLLVLGVGAFAGVPGTGLAVRIFAVLGAASAAGYLAHCGRLGVSGARKLAPTATIFALVTAAAGFQALGLFEANLVAPAAIGGFAAAGALLLALACVADNLELAATPHATAQALGGSRGVKPVQGARTRDAAAVVAAHQAVFDLDLKTGALALSPETAKTLGLPEDADEMSPDIWAQRIHPEDRSVYEQAIAAYRLNPGTAFRLEFRARGASGKMEWFELRATMTGKGPKAERCLGLIANVNARKSSEAELARAALNDTLTGLGNRMALLEKLEAADATLSRTSLAVFDIDRFKSVNTSVGPDGADSLLRSVAERMTQRFAGNASLFRVGGDMFALIANSNRLDDVGASILEMMKAPFIMGGREIFLPASVGMAAGGTADDALDLLGQAELAMIQAKRDGGARVCVYSRALLTPAGKPGGVDPVALETDLRNAIKKNQIEVHYQPIMRIANNGIAGFEALLRWRHPERGLIAPEEFVGHSEETGLIVPLGTLVLKRAAKDLARWQQFFPLKPPLFVSVNVSWRQLNNDSFAKELENVLGNAALPKRTLKLEITESAVMEDADAAETALKRLRKLGAGLAMDDFGTGHSSLSHLKRFPFDVIKIDKSFLAEAKKNGGDAILSSIVSLAHELEMEVVAEGVENENDAERLRALGCEYGQGYLFGAPLPPAEVNTFIAMTFKK